MDRRGWQEAIPKRNIEEQYCIPRSERNTRCPSSRRRIMAMLKASMTMAAVMSVRIDHPTTIRSKRSMITQRESQPSEVGK